MRSFIAIFTALSLLFPGIGTGQGSDSVFEEYDLDGDDVIDRIEFGMSAVAQKAREEGREETIGSRFDRLDTNRDNAVSRDEFLAATDVTAEIGRETFQENDRNKDEKLDTNEFLQASGDLQKLEGLDLEFRETDRNRDGFVDTKEWKLAISAKSREEEDEPANFVMAAFRDADRDSDDQLSQAEFSRTRLAGRMRQRGGRDMVEVYFARLDADRNSHLSFEEFASLAAGKRPPMAGGKGKGKGKGGKARDR